MLTRGIIAVGLVVWAGATCPPVVSAQAAPGPLPPRSGVVERGRALPGATVRAPLAAPLPYLAPWGGNVRVNQDIGVEPQNETSIATDPLNPLHLVGGANDYRIGDGDGACGVYRSFDAGRTWSDGLIDRAGFDAGGDPSVAIGPDGTAYYGCLHFDRDVQGVPQANALTVSRSKPGAGTFEAPRTVITGANFDDFHDKPYLTVDTTLGPHSGTLYLSWTHFSAVDARILLSRSTDGGQTWTPPVGVSDQPGLGLLQQKQGSVPVVGPDGTVYVAWMDFNAPFRIVVDAAANGGQTFGVDRTVALIIPISDPLPGFGWQFRTNSFPTMAVGPEGNLYVVWADMRNGDADILLSRSQDRGLTWSPPVRVNDDPRFNGRHQFFPWLAVGPDGALHVMFYDNRLGLGFTFNVFYARSTDGGRTWSANERVTTLGITPNTGEFAGNGFIGDYNGLAVSELAVHPFWTDTRTGNQDVFADRSPAQNAFAVGLGLARSTVRQGEALTMHLGAMYPAGLPPIAIDVYMGILRSDGSTLVFLTDLAGGKALGTLTDPSTYTPLATGIPIGGALDVALPDLAQFPVTAGDPTGVSVAFCLVTGTGTVQDGAIGPGDFVALSLKLFTVLPPAP